MQKQPTHVDGGGVMVACRQVVEEGPSRGALRKNLELTVLQFQS